VRLESGCQILADVQAATISLEEGGIVDGRLKMGSPRKS
jgi:cytoskeletal protein CcmA (bactofilin family)